MSVSIVLSVVFNGQHPLSQRCASVTLLGDDLWVDLIILGDWSQHLQLLLRDIIFVVIDDLSEKLVLVAQKISFDRGPVVLFLVQKDRDGFEDSLDAIRRFSESLDFSEVALAHLLNSCHCFGELVIDQFLGVRHLFNYLF